MDRSSRGTQLGVAGLALVAFLVRGWLGLREDLWFDEINTLYRADAGSPFGVIGRTVRDVQAPLYDLFMWAWTGLFGNGAVSVRLPSWLFGALSVPVLFLAVGGVGRSRRAGLVAAGWMALAPLLVEYGVECRPYSLLILLSCLLLLACQRVLESGGSRGVVLLSVCGPLIVLCHYYGLLALVAAYLFLLLASDRLAGRLGSIAASLVPAVAAQLLWYPGAVFQVQRREMNDVYDSVLDPGFALRLLDLHGVFGPWTDKLSTAWPIWVGRLALLALLIGGWFALRQLPRPERGGERPASCRLGGGALLVGGLVAAVCLRLLPESSWVNAASKYLHGGARLDADTAVFVGGIGRAWSGQALLVAGLGAVLLCLPALVGRFRPRAGWAAYPFCALLVPAVAVGLLELTTGRETLTARNTLILSPTVALLIGAGVGYLRPVRGLLLSAAIYACLLLQVQRRSEFRSLPRWGAAAAWVDERGAPLATTPSWTGFCADYHLDRPWGDTFGPRDGDSLASWVEGRRRVIWIHAFRDVGTPEEFRRVLESRYGKAREQASFGRVSARLYELDPAPR